MDITASNLQVLFRGFRTVFDSALQSAPTDWQDIAMRVPSTAAEELYTFLDALPGMKEFIGDLVIEEATASDFTIRNKKWADSVRVPREKIERDQYGLFNPIFSELGMIARQHPDELVADLLNNGFTGGANADYTGKAFFAEDKKHAPNKKGSATFSNKGTAALDADAFSAAKANLKGRKNEKGRSMKLGRELVLVVPPALEDTGLEILQAERNSAGATNIQRNAAKLKVLPDLTSETAWFLLETGRAIRPLIFQEEVAAELSSLTDPDNEHTFKTDEFLYKAYGRWNAGYGFPQLAYGSTGAGG